ncbi:ribonuclease Y [Chloroflexota bacterium]
MTIAVGIIAAVVGLALGFVGGYYYLRYRSQIKIESAEHQSERILADAETAAKEMKVQARDEAHQQRQEAGREIKRQERDVRKEEQRLSRQRQSLDDRYEQLDSRERRLNQQQSSMDKRFAQLEQQEKERLVELERVASMSQDEARNLLLSTVEQDARQDMARVIRQVEAEAKEDSDRRARKIVTLAIQRIASAQVSDVAISIVPLPSDDLKGRIIGRQGRNIRALERATGVDLVVDDTPEAVLLSCFDPMRREVARLALTKLILDGRIHPARIEKVVEASRDEVNQTVREAGEQAAIDAGVPGLHPEILKLLGRLNYRTSYGQNQLHHAVETAHLAGIMAVELGANVHLAKAGALLHDLGKAVDHEVEGPHALIGADLAKRYGVSPAVVNSIAAHHGEADGESLEAIIVEAADAISGARPGARRESMDTYIKRIKALEEVANSFDGIAESYAIQAGREIRIIVRPEQVDDLAAITLARDVAKAVEENLQYPGQIKVNVIRETRAVDFAK